jgi:CarD family transcriptional regulator
VFETGEYVVYGNLGVCRVQDRVTRRFDGLDAEHLYYVLEPVYQCRPTTPKSICAR